jgi:hypothetical protein
MAKAAMTEMERQIEEVRREAYAAGYSAAMQAIRDVASHPAESWNHYRSAEQSPTWPRPGANTTGAAKPPSACCDGCHPNPPTGTSPTARRQRAHNRRDPKGNGAVPSATRGDPQGASGQWRHDILRLDTQRAAPTGGTQRGGAGRR